MTLRSSTERMRGDDLYDYDAAAAHLLVSKRHVQRLVTDRRIAHIKMGRRTSFRLTDLESSLKYLGLRRSTDRESRPNLGPKPAPPTRARRHDVNRLNQLRRPKSAGCRGESGGWTPDWPDRRASRHHRAAPAAGPARP